MPLLSGAMSVRRFRVVGAIPDGWRDRYRDNLEENAFKDNPIEVGKEEREGWVQIHNLLDNVEGGRGIFGSMARAEIFVHVLPAAPEAP